MKPFKALTATGQSRRLRQVAQTVLQAYPLEDVRFRLVHYGENSTWDVRAIDTREGAPRRYLLRVHRPGYPAAAIRSELAWMEALRVEAGVPTAAVVKTRDGGLIAHGRASGVVGGRKAVLFEWIEGAMRAHTTVGPRSMWRIGELAARMHAHALAWRRPEGFRRPRWDVAGLIGEDGRYGSPLEVPGLRGRERRLIERLVDAVTEEVSPSFADDADDICLIHADLCLANVLFIGDRAHPIDFDDCGVGHRLYDIAVTFKNLAGRDRFAALHAAYQQGYWSVAHRYAWEAEDLSPFLMLRYLAELAWHGSRSDHPDVRADLPDAIAFVADRAEEYLAGRALG